MIFLLWNLCFFSVTENCTWRLYNIEDYFFTLKFMFFLSERIRIESYKGTLVEQLSGWIAHFANKALKFVSSISRMYRFDFEAVPKAALHDNFIMTWKVGYGHLSFFIFQNVMFDTVRKNKRSKHFSKKIPWPKNLPFSQ